MEQVKQTAINWFEYQLKDNLGNIVINQNWQLLEGLIEQAKEMEKEQIIEAHGDKKRTKSNSGSCVTYGYTFTGEMYYKETFK
jgi:hypothetical protein